MGRIKTQDAAIAGKVKEFDSRTEKLRAEFPLMRDIDVKYSLVI